MMSENEFVSLYEKYKAGKCSPEEISNLENYKDEFHLDYYTWMPDMGDKAKIWASLYTRLKQDREAPDKIRQIRRLAWWSAAAAVIIICSTSLGLYYTDNLKQSKEASFTILKFQTRNGEKKQITLQDGTVIHLNAKSTLVLEKGFNERTRNVQLIGEAYFDVAHNKALPFIVHTADFNIHVTGTAFNIKAYPEEKNSTATLIRGQIFMETTGIKNRTVMLKPGEKVTILKILPAQDEKTPAKIPELFSLTHYTQNHDSTIVETAWTENRLSIHELAFKDMKATLERWFDVDITINSKTVEGYRFTATFTNETLDDVLTALQKVQYFNYEINGKTVTIW